MFLICYLICLLFKFIILTLQVAPVMWKIHGGWICSSPEVSTCRRPEKLQPLTTLFNWGINITDSTGTVSLMYPMLINILISTMVHFVIKIKNYILRFWSMKVVTIKKWYILLTTTHSHTHTQQHNTTHQHNHTHTNTMTVLQ